MTILDDAREASEGLLSELAARLPELPKPVLAAIGAGDLAAERVLEWVGSVRESLPAEATHLPSPDDLGDLPGKAQQAATDLGASLQKLLSELPARAQSLFAELPDRAQEFLADVPKRAGEAREKVGELSAQLAPENVRRTAEAYGQLAGGVYESLADRGGQVWSKARTDKPVTEPAAAKAAPRAAAKPAPKAPAKPAATVAPKPAKPAKPAARKPAARPTVTPTPTVVPPAKPATEQD